MDRQKVTQRMLNMGFMISNKGFQYMIDALEMIDEEGEEIKFTAMYAYIAKKRKKDKRAVERCIRHEIESYYNTCNEHPYLRHLYLSADRMKNGRYPTKEFLMRLYMIVYKPELLEGGEDHA